MIAPNDLGPYGHDEGERCNRYGCAGIIDLAPVENCSCHISPPCHACVEAGLYCPICQWSSAENDGDPS